MEATRRARCAILADRIERARKLGDRAYAHADKLIRELMREREIERATHSLPSQAASGSGGGVDRWKSIPLHPQILIEVDDDGRETVLGPVMSGSEEDDCVEGADEDEEEEVERILRG